MKQDSDLKIPLNGLKMDQLDQIWFQIKRKIPFKLTCCDISKIAAQFIFELLPLTNQLRNIQAAFPVPSNLRQSPSPTLPLVRLASKYVECTFTALVKCFKKSFDLTFGMNINPCLYFEVDVFLTLIIVFLDL